MRLGGDNDEFAEVELACKELAQGRVVAIAIESIEMRYLTVVAEIATLDTIESIESAAGGLLWITNPGNLDLRQFPVFLQGLYMVGAAVFGQARPTDRLATQRSKACRVIVPVTCGRDGVFTRAGIAECASDLVKLAGFAPHAIVCACVQGEFVRITGVGPEFVASCIPIVRVSDVVRYRAFVERTPSHGEIRSRRIFERLLRRRWALLRMRSRRRLCSEEDAQSSVIKSI